HGVSSRRPFEPDRGSEIAGRPGGRFDFRESDAIRAERGFGGVSAGPGAGFGALPGDGRRRGFYSEGGGNVSERVFDVFGGGVDQQDVVRDFTTASFPGRDDGGGEAFQYCPAGFGGFWAEGRAAGGDY